MKSPAIVLLLCASIGVWAGVLLRWQLGLPIIPWSRRRPVGWSGWELLAVIGLYVLLASVLQGTLAPWLAGKLPQAAVTESQTTESTEAADHEVTQLLRSSAGAGTWLLCIFAAAVVAPLVEEFLFRVLLQGWLEKTLWHWRGESTAPAAWPAGALPVLFSSIPFALLHWRSASKGLGPNDLVVQLTVNATVNLATMTIAVAFLRGVGSATWRDLGIDLRRARLDLAIGALGVAAVLGPAYAVLVGAQLLMPQGVAPDPIPLFLLALALGYIYYRTHRLLPVFVLHALFNGFALASLWMSS